MKSHLADRYVKLVRAKPKISKFEYDTRLKELYFSSRLQQMWRK